MTRAARRDVRLLTMFLDLLVIVGSFVAASRVRVWLNAYLASQIDESLMRDLAPPLGLILILWIPAAAWIRLYRPRRGSYLLASLAQVVEAVVLVLMLTIVSLFFARGLGTSHSRAFVLLLGGLSASGMLAVRVGVWTALRSAGYWTIGAERVLVVGSGSATKALIKKMESAASQSIFFAGVVTPPGGTVSGVLGNPVPIVGTVAELPALINTLRVDRVLAVESEISPEELQRCVSVCTRMGVPLNHTAGILDAAPSRVEMVDVGGVRLVELRGIEFTRVQEIAKRCFDLVAASATLVALSPLFAAIAAAIKLTSTGPVLYVAPRVGRGGRYFRFYKFRTMVPDAEARREALEAENEKTGHIFKIGIDPRVTPVGRVLRRLSLDELPQLLNVLLGDMSLVGPRPLPAYDLGPDGLSNDYRAWAAIRSKVRPGITGMWQVRGRSSLSFEEMIRLDVAYVRRWSMRVDFMILLETIPAVLGGRGAC